DGADGGRLMRLLSEIQMTLHQHPAEHRRNRGEPDIHGLWLWGAGNDHEINDVKVPSIATRNSALQSIVEGQDAKFTMSEAERLNELLRPDMPLPKNIVLSGDGHAVLLTKSIFPQFGKTSWNSKSEKTEVELLSILRGLE
ncbi:MAG: threonine synthase, partial [Mariprofundaceae bacterium]